LVGSKKTQKLSHWLQYSLGLPASGGELAMLGITPTRSATILAATLCILWEVTQECMFFSGELSLLFFLQTF